MTSAFIQGISLPSAGVETSLIGTNNYIQSVAWTLAWIRGLKSLGRKVISEIVQFNVGNKGFPILAIHFSSLPLVWAFVACS
jgi:hypothetical protein